MGCSTSLIPHEANGEPKCAKCDRRERDDDAWHILFEHLAFQLYQENMMTTLQEMGEQPFTLNSVSPIMLQSTEG